VKQYNEETGATLLLTSHYMADVEALCPRIVVIDGGRVLWDGDREELVRRVRPVKTITLRFSQAVTRSSVEDLAAGHLCEPADGELREVTIEVPELEVKERLQLLLAALPVKDLVVADPPFERVLQDLLNAPGDRNGKEL
jgi:ABC-2 type transport system ATP-binding protein